MGEETVKFLRQSNGLVTLKHQPNPKLVTIVDRNYLQELRIQQWQRTSIPVIALLFSIAFLSLTLGPFLIRRAPDLTQVNYTSPIESASLEPDFNWWRKYPIYLAKPTVFGDWKGSVTQFINSLPALTIIIPGFISKVKNLKELGIKIIWISPIFDSLSIDLTLGYNQTFENGTIDDFQLLVRHLHANGRKKLPEQKL